ncbi:hypothetical protein HAX54_003849 [Datura stramonium]|uniref:Uncharacterized protein n=1 Tax=Datura stramonium TaxID=4076 RepID=A0ABS8T7B4_DATST|nr:hypothetical protein [Datura stramonium]
MSTMSPKFLFNEAMKANAKANVLILEGLRRSIMEKTKMAPQMELLWEQILITESQLGQCVKKASLHEVEIEEMKATLKDKIKEAEWIEKRREKEYESIPWRQNTTKIILLLCQDFDDMVKRPDTNLDAHIAEARELAKAFHASLPQVPLTHVANIVSSEPESLEAEDGKVVDEGHTSTPSFPAAQALVSSPSSRSIEDLASEVLKTSIPQVAALEILGTSTPLKTTS